MKTPMIENWIRKVMIIGTEFLDGESKMIDATAINNQILANNVANI
jgi:hypothetical protein